MKIKTFFTVAAVFAAVWSGRGGIAEFSVGCVNCGAFRYGNDNIPAEESAKEWSRLAADWQQDVFFYEDVGKGAPGNVSMPKFDISAAVKRQPETAEVVALSRSVEIGRKIQKTPRYRVLRLIYDLEGKKLAVYGVHLVAEGHIRGPKPAKGEMSPSQKLRQLQFKELIEDARRFDYAILAGDFNAQKSWEYGIFAESGFSVANCSVQFGTRATLRRIPADNIIVSPGLSFADFKVPDGYNLNTDHLPLVATVRFSAETAQVASAAPDKVPTFDKIPTVEEFLGKSASERRALFLDRRFREAAFDEKYPDGSGLLSRWVRVEKIPNLRDVGGIVNKDGKELARGVFFRSAGWNDNALAGKKRPKGEWKPGKSRLTEAGKKTALEKLGLKTDLDLRSDVECWGMTGSPLGDTVLWKQISFGHYDQFEKHAKYRDAVKEVFAVLADPARRPLVFHCIGGADRTGGLAFFIQALCDVDDDTLVKDWELTCCYTARSSFVHEKCIDRFLAMLAKYPGATTKERVRAFLRECGVTDAQMDAVRSVLLPVE
jgi:hypothetical protein